MKISFLIPAIVLYTVRVVFSNSVQVGTVLFSTTDLVRKCWTDYDKSLLKARAVMQDVLPDPDCLDFSNPEAVAILLDYFNACYQVISTSTYGKVQNVMYVALSDAFGGYLRAHVLPFVRKSYYGGMMTYSETQKLYALYDYIRAFLKTDGRGWAEPTKSRFRSHSIHVRPLTITGGTAEACRDLYIIEKEGKEQYLNPNGEPPWTAENKTRPNKGRVKHGVLFKTESQDLPDVPRGLKPFPKSMATLNPWKMSKVLDKKDEHDPSFSQNSTVSAEKLIESLSFENEVENFRNGSDEKQHNASASPDEQPHSPRVKTVIVPLPVLDDLESPNSIAVPFKKQPFRNLKSESSVNVLENYYVSVIMCFVAKGNTRNDIKEFNGRFHSWLTSKVLPHLGEEQWYPGFGGVMRVLETMKLFGTENALRGTDEQDYGFMFDDGAEFEVDSGFGFKGKYKTRDVCDVAEEPIITKRYFVTGIILTLIVLFLLVFAALLYWRGLKGQRFLVGDHEKRLHTHHTHHTHQEGNLISCKHNTPHTQSLQHPHHPQHPQHQQHQQHPQHQQHQQHPQHQQHQQHPQHQQHQQHPQHQQHQQYPQHSQHPQHPKHQQHLQHPQHTHLTHNIRQEGGLINLNFFRKRSKPDARPNRPDQPIDLSVMCSRHAQVEHKCSEKTKKAKNSPKTTLISGKEEIRKHKPHQRREPSAKGDAKGQDGKLEAVVCAHHARIATRRPHTIHTLWKKPSNVLSRYWTSGYEMEEESTKRNSTISLTGSDVPGSSSSNCSATVEEETKYNSTEAQTMTCNCSGSCHCTTLTDDSSTTKVKKRKSSTVTIFDVSDNVNPKQTTSKSSTQCLTTESGTESFCSSECSMSGESDLRKQRNSKTYP